MSKASTERTDHVVPLGIYLGVAALLCLLTAVTVFVAQIDLGGWNVVVALLVAAIKSTLVALIFMHLLYDKKLYLIVFFTAILFLAIFIIFTMFDTMRRGDIYDFTADPIKKNAAMYDSTGENQDSNAVFRDSVSIVSPDSGQGVQGGKTGD